MEHFENMFGALGGNAKVYEMEFKKMTPPHKGKKIKRIVVGVEKSGRQLVRFTTTVEDGRNWLEERFKEGAREMEEYEIKNWLRTYMWAEDIDVKKTIDVNVDTAIDPELKKDTEPIQWQQPLTQPPVTTPGTPPPVYVQPTQPQLEEAQCFIATATYGTSMMHKIQPIRNFRDQSLEPKFIGKLMIKMYYKISPSIAKLIIINEKLRKVTRALLNPIVKHFNEGE